jgi:hypothetical protein
MTSNDLLYRVISGKEFNKLFENVEFYKLTDESENHNNFQFIDGLNVDTKIFNPTNVQREVFILLKEITSIDG